ncbi:sensor histidine kinase [Paenibacillus sp. P26]|nr:sensor histidine kinase [Paenibacillus sp. P26]
MPMTARLRTGWKLYAALLLALLLAAGFLSAAAPEQETAYSLSGGPGWLVHLGDLPVTPDGAFDAAGADWRPMQEIREAFKGQRFTGMFWMKQTPPPMPVDGASLYVRDQKSFELYLDRQKLASVNFSPYDFRVNAPFQWRILPPPAGFEGKTLYARVYFDDRQLRPGQFSLGSGSGFWSSLLRQDINNAVLSTLFFGLGAFALFLFIQNRDNRLYWYFSLFAIFAGYGCAERSLLLPVLVHAPLFHYYHDVALPMCTFAFLAFLEQMYGPGKWKLRRRLWQTMLAFSAVCIAVGMKDAVMYKDMIRYVFPALFLPVFAGTAGVIVRIFLKQRDRETLWSLCGRALLLLSTFLHSPLIVNTGLPAFVAAHFPALYRMWPDQIFAGVFLFLSCLGMVLVGRFTQVHRQVRTYAAELEEKNERLMEVARLKDEFLANTSHELRTPLNGIIGLTESLLDGIGGPLDPRVRSNLQLVVSSGKRLANLINDIMDFAKLRHRDLQLNLEPVRLRERTDIVLAVFAPLARKKGIELAGRIGDALPPAAADGNRVEQILYNLIGNAIKFTESGRVWVEAALEEGRLRLSVGDTGIGIPAEKQEAIFEAFEQVEGSSSREHGGTGLGLPISRKLVELHGGSLTVESSPGQGSVFKLTPPVWTGQAEAEPVAGRTAAEDAPDPALQTLRLTMPPATRPRPSLLKAKRRRWDGDRRSGRVDRHASDEESRLSPASTESDRSCPHSSCRR